MTMQDVREHLKEDFEDETHDVAKYTEMAAVAKADGQDELAFWLWQIAHDEQSHASWIKHWMARNSIY